MKKTLLYTALLLTGVLYSQAISIPDPNLKAALLNASEENGIARDINQNFIAIDTNNNGQIEQSEAAPVHHLLVGMYEISSMAGVENFTNLETLDCSSNLLTSLNISGLPNLRNLSCGDNQLTSLTITGSGELRYLVCSNNNLTTLDLAGCPLLTDLDFSYNQVGTINLSQQTQLTSLLCSENVLTSLNLEGFQNLDFINCEYNQIETLNVNECPNLKVLLCSFNQITSIDISDSNPDILDCDNNQIGVLIIKNGADNSDSFYDFWGNPLQYLCVDESEAAAYIEILEFYEYEDVLMNTYCSFTPGSSYNTITGTFTFDAGNNGCDDSDLGQSFIKVHLNDGNEAGAMFTNSTGDYSFFTQQGSFTITPQFENESFTASPATVTVDFPEVTNDIHTENFCVTAHGVHPDAEIVIAPIEPAQPGFDAVYKIVYRNKGNQVLSGSISLTYNDAVLDFISAAPLQASGGEGLLTWNYSSLMPHESRSILVTLNVNSPMEEPAVNIDDVLPYQVTLVTDSADEMPEDNAFSYDEVVIGSFDPNDITCLEGKSVSPDAIGEYLHYRVNFENTGTAPATFIVVQQEINPADFDIASFQVLSTSHNVMVKVEGNTVVYRFDDINLGPQEHGHIVFKVKSNSSLEVGDNVMNMANIFFDYNWPIETNEALTAFEVLGREHFTVDNSVSVYPNPVKNTVQVKADSAISLIELYDLQGRLLQVSHENSMGASMELFSRQNGVYILKITTGKGVKAEQIVKE